jgi:hypothetical protein
MTRIYRSRAALRITGEDLQPDEITRLLGAAPTRSHARGDARRRPRGGATSYDFGMWLIEADPYEPEGIDAQTEDILSQLSTDLAVWRDLAARYHLDLFCGLFLGSTNEGGGLSPATMRALGERGIALDLDIYGSNQAATGLSALEPSSWPLPIQADRFADEAAAFCQWGEHGLESPAPQGLVNEARIQLSGLYAHALRLPTLALIEAEQVIADAQEGADASALVPRPPALDPTLEQTFQARFARLPFGLYRSFPAPHAADDEAVTRDLRESLLDLCRGLWRGLWLHQHGHPLAALWEWRFVLDVHWGVHITGALQALASFDGDSSGERALSLD